MVFRDPGEEHYNPIVHGGYASTMLDTVLGCAHTTLAAGEAYSTLTLEVKMVRPITRDSGGRATGCPIAAAPGDREPGSSPRQAAGERHQHLHDPGRWLSRRRSRRDACRSAYCGPRSGRPVCPSKTILPPSAPAPGPRSMIQSACAITAWSCRRRSPTSPSRRGRDQGERMLGVREMRPGHGLVGSVVPPCQTFVWRGSAAGARRRRAS